MKYILKNKFPETIEYNKTYVTLNGNIVRIFNNAKNIFFESSNTTLTIVRYKDGSVKTFNIGVELDQRFAYNTDIIEIKLANNVLYILDKALVGCSYLKTIELSDSLLKIGKDAFSTCIRLKNVKIPTNTNIGIFAFNDCINLKLDKII